MKKTSDCARAQYIFSQTLRFELASNTTIQAVSHLSLRPDDGNGKLPMMMSMREANIPHPNRHPLSASHIKECGYA